MKRTILIGGLLIFLSTLLRAQELKVESFERLDMDLLARTSERLDRNDVPCAVLRVSVRDAQSFTFAGNIIGEVVYQPGEALVYLTDRSRERDLWIPHLHNAWPKGTDRAELNRAIYAINKVRNRVAHNERLFDPARDEYLPSVVDRDIIRLLQALCPEAAGMLYGDGEQTSVERYVLGNPVPADVRL